MKIKCIDGKVRRFRIAKSKYETEIGINAQESKCLECGEEFGVSDTKVLKPIWKKHTCNSA